MPNVPIIYQKKPAAGVTEILVCFSTLSTITEFLACNESAVADSMRISVNGMFIYFDTLVSGNTTFAVPLNNWIPPGTIIKVYSLNGTISFTLFTQVSQ